MGQKGFILITVTIIMAVLLALGGVHLSMISSEQRLTLRSYRRVSAINLAEAGVELAIWELNYGNIHSWSGSPTQRTKTVHSSDLDGLSAGDFTVTAYNPDSANPVIVTTGYTPSMNSPLMEKRRVKVALQGAASKPPPIFDYALASEEQLNITGSSCTDSIPVSGQGNIYSSTSIRKRGSGDINGSASTPGAIDHAGSGDIAEKHPGADLIEFPEIDPAPYITAAQAGGTSGNIHLTGSSAKDLGPVYIDGDLQVSGSGTVTLKGTVYVMGEVKVSGSGGINANGYAIVAEGNIDFSGSGDRDKVSIIMSLNGNIEITGSGDTNAIIYAPNGEIKLAGSGDRYGSIVGNEIDLSGSGDIYYDTAVKDTALPGFGMSYEMVSWQEK